MRFWQHGSVGLLALATVLAGASASLKAQGPQASAEPVLRMREGSFFDGTYGDARNVQMLADLLKDADPLVRERATVELGQTDNGLAAEPIRSMLKDPDLGVRCTALTAMAELAPNLARPLVSQSLGAEEPKMLLAATRLVLSLRMADARPAVEKLLSRKEPLVVTTALETLSGLGLPAPAEAIQRLLADDSAAVRLRAAQNALLAPAGAAPVDALLKVAREDAPQVRAAVLAALGKAAFASVEPLLPEAAKSKDPAVRRGALWAYRYGGKADRIRSFLDDESPMVVLAAIEAAGELKAADCIDRLMALLPALQDDQAHFAARIALAAMGQAKVPQLAADGLKKIAPEVLRAQGGGAARAPAEGRAATGPASSTQSPLVFRNARSYSWLLGEYRSPAGLETQIELVRSLPVNSRVLMDLAPAMARAGDASAKEPIRRAIQAAADHAPAYLVFRKTEKGSYPPFEEAVTACLIQAAGEFKDTEAVPLIVRFGQMEYQGLKLLGSAAASARVLPLLATDTNRDSVEKALDVMLRDHGAHGNECTFEACKAAARLKLTSAVPYLEKVLSERDGRQLINVSAWALGQITGKTPPLPDPLRRQGRWIIRVVETP